MMQLVRLPVMVEHLVAQITQTHAGVAVGVGIDEMRQHRPQLHVRVIVLLEPEQRRQQRAPLGLGHPDREEEENREILRLLVLEAMAHEIGRDDRGRDAALFE